MSGLLLRGESKKDIAMLNELAKKIGLKTRLIGNEEMEELGLINAMKTGRTRTYINTDKYLKKIKAK